MDSAARHATRRVPIAAPDDQAGRVRDRLAGRTFDCATHIVVCDGDRFAGLLSIETLLAARRPILILGEPGTGHDVAAQALRTADAPWVALADGTRLAANPAALIEEAHEGTLYCAEIGQYTKSEQKGLAFLVGKLERHAITLVATSSEALGVLAAEGKFDAALLSALSAGAVMLPPLRVRREDIPPLIERLWRAGGTGEPLLATLQPSTLATLANAHWPGNLEQLASVDS